MTGGRRFAFKLPFARFVFVPGVPFAFEFTCGGVEFEFALPLLLSFALRLDGFRFSLLSFEFELELEAELFSCLEDSEFVFVFVSGGASPSFVGRLISTATV